MEFRAIPPRTSEKNAWNLKLYKKLRFRTYCCEFPFQIYGNLVPRVPKFCSYPLHCNPSLSIAACSIYAARRLTSFTSYQYSVYPPEHSPHHILYPHINQLTAILMTSRHPTIVWGRRRSGGLEGPICVDRKTAKPINSSFFDHISSSYPRLLDFKLLI